MPWLQHFLFAAPAIIDPGDNVTTEIIGGGVNYFRTSCAIFSSKVLVELIDVSGSSFLYASSSKTNPGPLTANTQSNTTTGVIRRTVTVTLSRNSKVLYRAYILRDYFSNIMTSENYHIVYSRVNKHKRYKSIIVFFRTVDI